MRDLNRCRVAIRKLRHQLRLGDAKTSNNIAATYRELGNFRRAFSGGDVRLGPRRGIEPKIADAVAACKFTHKVRHNLLAHRNAAIAMKLKPSPEASRQEVLAAIAAHGVMFG